MSDVEAAIHFNRDENSFTARFFERLILKFETDENVFNSFLSTIESAAKRNKDLLENTSLEPPSFARLTYKDGMPFLENLDLYSYCKAHKLSIDIDQEKVDKTEFDYVIVAEDGLQNKVIIVFEVKCFTDLKQEEILRQNELLRKYNDAKLFSRFYHIALIAHENISRGNVPKERFPYAKSFSIISWDDIKTFIDFNRIKKEIELLQLNKTVQKNGNGRTGRRLIRNGSVG